MKRCPYCAKQLRDDALQCSFCNKLLDQASEPQHNLGEIWKKNREIIAILVIIVVCGIAFINSNNKHDKKVVSNRSANAEKENTAKQSSEQNKEDLDNYGNQARVNEIRQQEAENIIIQRREEQQQREQQRIEIAQHQEQQREQQQVERELQQYEREKQQDEMKQKQDEIRQQQKEINSSVYRRGRRR
jgi:preprotein translocase subunit SecF